MAPQKPDSLRNVQVSGLLKECSPVLVGSTVEDLERAAKVGAKFGTVYADPPWRYDNRASNGAAESHYPTMTTAEIAALPIQSLVADDAHLHLWTTASHLFEAESVIEAWGFRPVAQFVWVKPEMGLGNYWRMAHEFLLLGVRGNCTFEDKTLKSWGEFKRGRHSSKPDEVRAMVERASPGARLELFGRKASPNWAVWGNQAPKDDFDAEVFRLAA